MPNNLLLALVAVSQLLLAVSQLLLLVRMERQRRALRSAGEAIALIHVVLRNLVEQAHND